MFVKLLDLPLLVDEVLCKGPFDLGLSHFLEPLEKVVCVVAHTLDLSKDWKLYSVGLRSPFLYFFLSIRLLLAELVAGES